MRKRYKKKLRACGVCKPNKKGHTKRHTPKELEALIRAEKEIRNYINE